MSGATHTALKLPLDYYVAGDEGDGYIGTPDDTIVAEKVLPQYGPLIVRAANAHEELVTVARLVLSDPRADQSTKLAARTAIAKLGGAA